MAEMNDLNGRSALVTGGSKGVGKGISECLSEAGARVAVVGTDTAAAKQTAAELAGEAIAISADVSDADSVAAMAERVRKELGGLDIVVNNAGVNLRPMPLQDVSETEWDRVMDVNLRGVFLVSRAVIPMLIESDHGRLLNISSIIGQSGYPLMSPYVASKFAVTGITQSLAHELAPYGVTVNTIYPGIIQTQMNSGIVALLSESERRSQEEVWETWKARIPLGTFQSPRDVGEMAAFLASDRARHVTGAAFNVDGGIEMH
jgi:NAD(P)-dependent dehydrogenase (short-subunit alcohol dehydrogenase family)